MIGHMPRVSAYYSATRRDQILQAARRCFARDGFRGTSMQQICAESSLSPGAVYGYFPSKEDLVMAIVEQVLAKLVPELDAIPRRQPPPLPDVTDRLLAALTDHDPDGELAHLAVQVWAEALGNPTLAARLSDAYHTMIARLTDLVATYQRERTLDAGTPAADIATILTMLGPAYLLSRVLLGQTEAFQSGLAGLLSQTTGTRRRPSAPRAR